MKVAIIGASGLLGGHLIEEGLKSHHEIIAVARKFPMRSAAHFFREQITTKNLDASTDLKSTDLEGVDLLINVAAQVSPSQDRSLIDENLELVKKVFTAAEAAKVSKLVQISSISTMASGEMSGEVSEQNHGHFRKTPYAESKYQSDVWLEGRKNLLTIHPCYMLGKWDSKPSSGAILMALQMKRLTGFYPGMKNFVHAGDVARGIYDAVEKNTTGRFILGGENVSLEVFLSKAMTALGLDGKLEQMSLDDLEANPVFKDFFLAGAVNDQKARTVWGYHSDVHLDGMLGETIAYFRDNKLLPKKKT
jgi:dihydroflavonol-4-reductase